VLPPEYFLSVHMNPMHLERNTDFNQKIRTLGFGEMMEGMVAEIVDYYSEESYENCPYLAVIKGEIGSGKTAFARQLIDELHSTNDFVPYLRHNKEKLPIFTSTVNAETQLHFLNIWKPIFQMMMVFFCKQKNLKKEIYLADAIIKTGN
jgi:Cdc6-like AAA superfamily ATPase